MASVDVLIVGPITHDQLQDPKLNIKYPNIEQSQCNKFMLAFLASFKYKHVITQTVLVCKPQKRYDIKPSLKMLYRSYLSPWFHHTNFFCCVSRFEVSSNIFSNSTKRPLTMTGSAQ
jgi:hypothetical protein